MKQFERYSKIFILLFAFNVMMVFLLFLALFIQTDLESLESFRKVILFGLGIIVGVTQVMIFCLFQLLQVYFYRMGLKYVKILKQYDEYISIR